MSNGKLKKLRSLLQYARSTEELCNILGVSEDIFNKLIFLLRDSDIAITEHNGTYMYTDKLEVESTTQIPIYCKGWKVKILLLGDTHIGAKDARCDLIKRVYGKAEQEDVDIAIHCGDFLEGRYPGTEWELSDLLYPTLEEQVSYAVECYPQFDGKTYFITGNHDKRWKKILGINVGELLSQQREDLVYLGHERANAQIEKVIISVNHGNNIESISRKVAIKKHLDILENKPDIFVLGHVHHSFSDKYKDTYIYQVPSFLDNGTYDDMGAWIITLYFDNQGNIDYVEEKPIAYQKKSKCYTKTSSHK